MAAWKEKGSTYEDGTKYVGQFKNGPLHGGACVVTGAPRHRRNLNSSLCWASSTQPRQAHLRERRVPHFQQRKHVGASSSSTGTVYIKDDWVLHVTADSMLHSASRLRVAVQSPIELSGKRRDERVPRG